MELEAAVRTRRSEHRLLDPAPSDEEFTDLLGWAATAPDHGHLRPWRWILVRGEGRAALGASFASGATDAETSRREARKPLRAPLLATLVLVPQRNHRVPHWEQLAASSAMVNSLMLLLHGRGFGSIWRTGSSVDSAGTRALLGLAAHEGLIGWLYVGTPDPTRRSVPRSPVPVSDRVSRLALPLGPAPSEAEDAREITSSRR
ncbi:nitroreductase family protein [Streptomyces sp. H39-S7]|uniref:nitroreductase family protein n=1 Tax=Streptomyces sp. H39-S7 TaxID=3004357 RepID=UPI0022AFABEA|nr:nitroreductase [Streptomyces sp. H39-S7]MCZ4123615.1 nitroreductase [Streptomyces sp. H39-S7]